METDDQISSVTDSDDLSDIEMSTDDDYDEFMGWDEFMNMGMDDEFWFMPADGSQYSYADREPNEKMSPAKAKNRPTTTRKKEPRYPIPKRLKIAPENTKIGILESNANFPGSSLSNCWIRQDQQDSEFRTSGGDIAMDVDEHTPSTTLDRLMHLRQDHAPQISTPVHKLKNGIPVPNFNFFGLPKEIRNLIYSHTIPRYNIFWSRSREPIFSEAYGFSRSCKLARLDFPTSLLYEGQSFFHSVQNLDFSRLAIWFGFAGPYLNTIDTLTISFAGTERLRSTIDAAIAFYPFVLLLIQHHVPGNLLEFTNAYPHMACTEDFPEDYEEDSTSDSWLDDAFNYASFEEWAIIAEDFVCTGHYLIQCPHCACVSLNHHVTSSYLTNHSQRARDESVLKEMAEKMGGSAMDEKGGLMHFHVFLSNRSENRVNEV
ncbi:MAG: hypothetical protein M1820_002414 [Bogoriella megaspora]|nr:MAG: hypothetical protein M1820_002414 [Bogoriella megaspora]